MLSKKICQRCSKLREKETKDNTLLMFSSGNYKQLSAKKFYSIKGNRFFCLETNNVVEIGGEVPEECPYILEHEVQ